MDENVRDKTHQGCLPLKATQTLESNRESLITSDHPHKDALFWSLGLNCDEENTTAHRLQAPNTDSLLPSFLPNLSWKILLFHPH